MAAPLSRCSTTVAQVIDIAHLEAACSRASSVTPAHLLISLMQAEGVARTVLEAYGFTLEELRRKNVPVGHNPNTAHAPINQLPLASSTQKVFELARQQADLFRQSGIRTEHLLLAIMLEGESYASSILRDASLNYTLIAQSVINCLTVGRPLVVIVEPHSPGNSSTAWVPVAAPTELAQVVDT